MTEKATSCQNQANNETESELEDIAELFTEVIPSDKEDEKFDTKPRTVSKKKRTKMGINRGDTIITCATCGTRTTYKDFEDHEKTEVHKLHWQQMKQEARKKKKRRAKNKKQDASGGGEPQVQLFQEIYKREKYYIRQGETLPPHRLLYIYTLTTFWALRYCFSGHNKNFKVSLINSKWMEFGDIVIELGNNQEITEIQAVQCKQIQSRNSILLATLTADMGKFSLKTRCDILKKLQRKADYDKTYFRLYTVSNLAINRETFTRLVYDDKVLESWKNENDRSEWKNRSLIMPEYKKMNILNTTDEPTDICIFRIAGPDLGLDKFCMLTNQKKIEGLKHLVKSTLRNQFPNCKDITNDIINHIRDYFKLEMKNTKHYKLTKTDFLLKVTELLLESYLVFPENLIGKKTLKLWNRTLLSFDLAVVRNHSDMVRKIYSAINDQLKEETQCNFDDFPNFSVKKGKVENDKLNSEIFSCSDCHVLDLSLQDLYLAMWRAQLTPLVLSADDENDLSLINNVIEFLKDENIAVKFIILTKNPKLDRSIFSKSLNIFFNLQDLEEINNELLEDILRGIKIHILDFETSLESIVECNDHFLEKVTPDALLNMFLKEYSFQDIYVPMTDEVVDNTIVLNDDDIEKVGRYFQRQDTETENSDMSYVVSLRGKPTQIQVPPEL